MEKSISNTSSKDNNYSPEERLSYYFDQGFPNSLSILDKKNETISQMLNQLENNYQSAGNDITKQYKAKENAKKYLIQTLTNVTSDLNTIAGSIEQCIDLQTQAVDSINSDINILQQQLLLSKEIIIRSRYTQQLGDTPQDSLWITRDKPAIN